MDDEITHLGNVMNAIENLGKSIKEFFVSWQRLRENYAQHQSSLAKSLN